MPQCNSLCRGAMVSLIIWGCICWNGPGPITIVNDNIDAEKILKIMEDEA